MSAQTQESVSEIAGRYWNERLSTKTPERIRWWDDETTRRHINRIVCGDPADGLHAGFHARVSTMLTKPGWAVSVGCGTGTKEFGLLLTGAVAHFDLYEISEVAAERGTSYANERGLAGRFKFHIGDAFKADIAPASYDLVYWNNALHHMLDATAAVAWSFSILKPGGLFAMDDFVGPSRFQWTDDNLRWASQIRKNLPDRLLRNPWLETGLVETDVPRPTPEEVTSIDPSEAADSSRILSAIEHHFRAPEIIPTGGAIYHTGLNDIFCNFVTDEDMTLLRHILMIDQLLAERGTTQYAVAFARKSGAATRNRRSRIASLFGRSISNR
jgi:SAM-dependent methyltransferase